MKDFKSFSSTSTSYSVIDKFIGQCLMSVVYAHSAHFMTDSYSQHKAFEEFYEGMQDLIDSFVEIYIGTGMTYRPMLNPIVSFDALSYIKSIADQAQALKPDLSGDLQNTLDEISGLCHKTLYKLTHLK